MNALNSSGNPVNIIANNNVSLTFALAAFSAVAADYTLVIKLVTLSDSFFFKLVNP